MKKTILFLTILILSIALAACGGNTAANDAASSNIANSTSTDATKDFSVETPLETELWMGTVKLDETEYAIDATQAAALLPLWKALRSLGESETAAQAEIDAVVSQIERTLTADQLNAISEMGLTMQNMGEVAEKLGLEMGFGGGRLGEMDPEMQATREAARESGQGPGGGLPGSGQGPGGGRGIDGAEMDPDTRATAIAERGGTRGARFGMNTEFLEALIEFLEAKMQ